MNSFTVALVIRNRDSCDTVSTSGELFIIVLTLARGKFADPDPLDMFIINEAMSFRNRVDFTAPNYSNST